MNQEKLPDIRKATAGAVAALLCFLTALPSYAIEPSVLSDDNHLLIAKTEEVEDEPPDENRANVALGALQRYLVKGDYRSAFPLVKVLADKGYLTYQVLLARMYLNGQGTKRDVKQAAEWYAVAAQKGSKEASSQLGRMYFNGDGVPQDFKTARKYLEVGPDNGEAALMLGRIYSDGLGVERDYSKAIDYFKRADSLGTDTKIIIGILYSLGGFGIEKNFAQAKKWLELSIAQKNPLAECALGFVYFEGGHGIKKDIDKAKQCIMRSRPILEKKSAGGNPTAQKWLGRICYLGLFQPKQYDKARKLFEASQDADSLYMLGLMSRKGQGGLKKDYKKTMDYFKRADQAGSFVAKVGIGEMYYQGLGVPRNFCEAKRWFEQASRNDDPVARYYLGMMYANGECLKKDVRRAKLFFQLAGPGLELAKATNEDCIGYLKHLNTDLAGMADVTAAEQQEQPADTTSGATKPPGDATTASTTPVTPVNLPPTAPVSGPKREFPALCEALEKLVLEFYPRAKITKDAKSIHFEYKAKSLKLPMSDKQMVIPSGEGVVGDLVITPGKYQGTEFLPFETTETLYVSVLMAPYSVSTDSHLLTHFLYPSSTTPDFVSRFKQIVNSFQ